MLILHHMHEYQTLFNNIKYNSFPFLCRAYIPKMAFSFLVRMLSCISFFSVSFFFPFTFKVYSIVMIDGRYQNRVKYVEKNEKLSIKIMRFTGCHCFFFSLVVRMKKKTGRKIFRFVFYPEFAFFSLLLGQFMYLRLFLRSFFVWWIILA